MDYEAQHNLRYSASDESTFELDSKCTDQFEGILYKTVQCDSATIVVFCKRDIFNIFVNKIRSDFALGNDENLKCTTHINSMKTNISVDIHPSTVTATGVGHMVWRSHSLVNSAKKVLFQYLNQENKHDSINSCYKQASPVQPKRSTDTKPRVVGKGHVNQSQVNAENITKINKNLLEMQNNFLSLQKELLKGRECHGVLQNDSPDSPVQNSEHTKHASQSLPAQKQSEICKDTPIYKIETIQGNRQNVHIKHINNQTPLTHNREEIRPRNSTRNAMRSKTLIIGSSILHGINPQGLTQGTHKHSISGAGIDDIADDILLYDLSSFSTVIIYIGGNDVARGMSGQMFKEKYMTLLESLKISNPKMAIVVCTLCPRGDVDVFQFNDCIEELAAEACINCIDMCQAFRDKDGNPINYFFNFKDNIHLSRSGIKRLLGTINNFTQVCGDFNRCVFVPRRTSLENGNNNYGTSETDIWKSTWANLSQHGDTHRHLQWKFSGRCFNCDRLGHKAIHCYKQ